MAQQPRKSQVMKGNTFTLCGLSCTIVETEDH